MDKTKSMDSKNSILDFDQYQDSEVGAKCRQALEQRLTGKMTEKEFNEYMAFLILADLREFCFRIEPKIPEALHEFKTDQNSYDWKRKTKEERQNIEARVFGRPEVQDYYQELSSVMAKNIASAYWLEEYIRIWRDAGNKENARKCWDIYSDFPQEIRLADNATVIWKKKVF